MKYKTLNWNSDDGIFLPMINDINRNNFYDKLLSRYVRDQNCVDIGFGTGLLSLLAIKHGAKSIIAFEKDSNRFELGQYVINRLGLMDKITLINDQFTGNNFIDYSNSTIFFHEVMNHEIFGEGLWKIFPKQKLKNQIFLPSHYGIELWTCEISDLLNMSLDRNITAYQDVPWFNPGIDVDHNFIKVINEILQETYATETQKKEYKIDFDPILPGRRKINEENMNDWGKKFIWNKMIRSDGNISAYYKIDISNQTLTILDKNNPESNKQILDLDNPFISLTLDMSMYGDKNVLIYPRAVIGDKDYKFYLDQHWPKLSPVVATKYNKDITMVQILNLCPIEIF
jgi:hypothetical protein